MVELGNANVQVDGTSRNDGIIGKAPRARKAKSDSYRVLRAPCANLLALTGK
ncbi:MAG TPA: hypothetical protein VEJ67_02025 [Candidatus Cybelea sp.]|nr:hypothetical protein [Candidatus Cybelea sp.]